MTMARLSTRWMRFWFDPSAPGDLGVSRVLFFSGMLLMYAPVDFSDWGQVSAAFWMPNPLFRVLHLGPPHTHIIELLQFGWWTALLCSAVGLGTVVSQWIAFVLGCYLLGLPHNFGHTFHFDALLVIVMGVLACSRSGDAWSIDAALARRHPGPSGEYTWPLRAIWTAMSLVFFAAGIAKLRHGGFEWVFSSNLSLVLARAPYHVSDADPITNLGLWIAGHEWMSRSVAAITIIVELGFISALFSRTARRVFVPAAFLMLIGIRVLMGPTFGGFLIANVFWVPWTRLVDAIVVRAGLRRRRASVAPVGDPSTVTWSDV
jgi:hypothetical protein